MLKRVFFAREDQVLNKYNEICGVIKKIMKIKFHSKPIYGEKYLKTKVTKYDGAKKPKNFR